MRDETGGVDWDYIMMNLEHQPHDLGIYLNGESLKILEHNRDNIRTMFHKNQWWQCRMNLTMILPLPFTEVSSLSLSL